MMIGKLLILFGLFHCLHTISNADEQNNEHELGPGPLVDELESLSGSLSNSDELPVKNQEQEEDAPTTIETPNDINDTDTTINLNSDSNLNQSSVETTETTEMSEPASSDEHDSTTTTTDTPFPHMTDEHFTSEEETSVTFGTTQQAIACYQAKWMHYFIGGWVGFGLVLGTALTFSAICNIWAYCQLKNAKRDKATDKVLSKKAAASTRGSSNKKVAASTREGSKKASTRGDSKKAAASARGGSKESSRSKSTQSKSKSKRK